MIISRFISSFAPGHDTSLKSLNLYNHVNKMIFVRYVQYLRGLDEVVVECFRLYPQIRK